MGIFWHAIQLCHSKGGGHIFEGQHIFERLPENYIPTLNYTVDRYDCH